ncbi:hypothetical protein ADUPG1_008837, partial [Aduncisulcus paluster]
MSVSLSLCCALRRIRKCATTTVYGSLMSSSSSPSSPSSSSSLELNKESSIVEHSLPHVFFTSLTGSDICLKQISLGFTQWYTKHKPSEESSSKSSDRDSSLEIYHSVGLEVKPFLYVLKDAVEYLSKYAETRHHDPSKHVKLSISDNNDKEMGKEEETYSSIIAP